MYVTSQLILGRGVTNNSFSWTDSFDSPDINDLVQRIDSFDTLDSISFAFYEVRKVQHLKINLYLDMV